MYMCTALEDNAFQNFQFRRYYLGRNIQVPQTWKHSLGDNLDRFLRFCKLHASFEQQRQVFFSMCARQLVKERQLVLLTHERDAYEEKAEFVDKLMNTAKHSASTFEQRDVKQCFESLVDTFAENSFQLCSLNSRLHFWETANKVKTKSKPPQEDATNKLSLLNWQLQHHRKLLSSLELEITQLFK
uniref:Uncharacterized protein n=1 Tax=Ditylenchus dipsaci TaxID=166011 RepID=A0A915E0Z1_9BILA